MSIPSPQSDVVGSAFIVRSVFIYDGECALCNLWVKRIKKRCHGAVAFESYQRVACHFPEISLSEFRAAAHWVDAEGHISRGAEAVYEMLASGAGKRSLLWAYRKVPGFSRLSEIGYGFVARHRPLLYRLTKHL
jgi:predicted DCC family thiol-disulfide oxidoreductase YuxK